MKMTNRQTPISPIIWPVTILGIATLLALLILRPASIDPLDNAASFDTPNHSLSAAEAYVKDNPKDGEAWSSLAPSYAKNKQWLKAAHAYENAAEYAPYKAADRSRLMLLSSQAYFEAASGEFSQKALDRLEDALKLDAQNIRAAFLQTLVQTQNIDNAQQAASYWQDFIQRFPGDRSGLLDQAKARKSALQTP